MNDFKIIYHLKILHNLIRILHNVLKFLDYLNILDNLIKIVQKVLDNLIEIVSRPQARGENFDEHPDRVRPTSE